jgi:uncharacterized membrane protein YoaK (UPF0700 family)
MMVSADTARQSDSANAPAAVPATASWLAMALFTGVLSMTAGSMDVIGFLGLSGLFTAHITGNLVILAAHMASGDPAQLAPMLSVPVFMVVLFLARLFAGGLEAVGRASLRPLLLLQFAFLAVLLALCLAVGTTIDANAPLATVVGMLGVAAMAVQNALVQVSLRGVPATAVITTNVARFATDIGTVLLRANPAGVAKARRRANHTWPSIAGFIIGCAIGAVGEAELGLRALLLPAGLALLALVMAWAKAIVANAEAPNPARAAVPAGRS